MIYLEKRAVFSIACIYAFRMLGLFIILPILSLYVDDIIDATPTLIGFALGIYGLSQALLQIVLGILSDYYGRKPIIIFGLLLFILGSLVAACSVTIYGIIIGRALQGAGAIGSTLIALVADVTKEENRIKAMSVIGMTIGLSFVLAITLGPMLNNIIGLSGIFGLTAALGCIGIIILCYWVPTPSKIYIHRDSKTVIGKIKQVLAMGELMRLNGGIFILHAILTTLFLAMPMILENNLNITESQQWRIYLPVLMFSFLVMAPFIIIADKKNLIKPIFLSAITLLTLTQAYLSIDDEHLFIVSFILIVFFASFTLLEATLPSLVSKISPLGSKGTTMGIYASIQFFGIFIGGTAGGFLFHAYGATGIFIFNAILGMLWISFALTMEKPKALTTKILRFDAKKCKLPANMLQQKILTIQGIKEAMVCFDERVIYLKIDKHHFDEPRLMTLLKSF